MAELIILGSPGLLRTQELYDRELRRLKERGALQRKLQEIDKLRSFRRVYVMGCGRSGTWLLTHVMGAFNDTDIVRQELDVAYFGLMMTNYSALVIKRNAVAYQAIKEIPESIEIAYIVRHPFDVLTSQLPGSGRLYHISPDRWLGEMSALRYLVDTRRKNTKIVRYEDLVTDPVETQSDLAGFYGFDIRVPITEIATVSNNPTEGPGHRSRKLDVYSIHKHRHDHNKLQYLRVIRIALGKTLDWVGMSYNYDLSIFDEAVN
jgi:hypothetical protein